MFATKNDKKKKHVQGWESQIEALRGLPGGASQTLADNMKQGFEETWDQILGLEKQAQKMSGDLHAGESIDLSQASEAADQEEKHAEYSQPGLDYHRQFSALVETRTVSENSRDLQLRINQIINELQKLTSASTELSVQFEEVSMEDTPVEPGTYHLNFFEWVFAVIQKARERIEESQTWLTTFQSKKKQKGYWGMFKKHGTSFGLSNERVVATQTG